MCVESRILIGSVSRLTLKALLDEHMKGVYEHAQQIRDQVRDQVIFHRSQDDEDDDQLEIVSDSDMTGKLLVQATVNSRYLSCRYVSI